MLKDKSAGGDYTWGYRRNIQSGHDTVGKVSVKKKNINILSFHLVKIEGKYLKFANRNCLNDFKVGVK